MSFRRTVSVLVAPNLERSGAFYRDVLGYVREIGDPGCGCREGRLPDHGGACPHTIPAAELGDLFYSVLVIEDVDA
jgi:hypothetical protein